MPTGAFGVAKKKSGSKPTLKPTTLVSVCNLRGSAEYRNWFKAAADKTRYPTTAIMRAALALWADKNGIDPPPTI